MSAPAAYEDRRRFGPLVRPDGTVFRLWSPTASTAEVVVGAASLQMARVEDGFLEAFAPGIGPGAEYAFAIDGKLVPDPASRRQADTVEGASVVVDPAQFGGNRRLGRPFSESAIVEVHVGTATQQGTFRALIDRLDHYVRTGFTVVQLMPISDFPGRWNWGYDGVLPFAPARAYGTPEDLMALIAAAHARGLSVYLDVVYNHFGPSGNFIPHVAPAFFDEGVHTPWGAAIDFRREPVRRYFIENVRMWLEDYGFDGLRFDAVHAYHETARYDFLREMMDEIAELAPRPHLIAENEDNTADILERDASGRPFVFDAQWQDDYHNALHVLVSGETEGYYRAYANEPLAMLVRTLAQGFAYQGEPNPLKNDEPRGQPSGHLPPTAFVAFAQNHDQIGNRPLGDPLTRLIGQDGVAFARFVTLMSPHVPLMFMGEEWGTERPFPFFCDFTGDLAEAIRQGRKREFGEFAGFHGEIPDALSMETFRSAKRDWSERARPEHRAFLTETQRLLDLRARRIGPLLRSRFLGADGGMEDKAAWVTWRFEGGTMTMLLNPSPHSALLPSGPATEGLSARTAVATCGSADLEDDGLRLGRWSAAVWIAS